MEKHLGILIKDYPNTSETGDIFFSKALPGNSVFRVSSAVAAEFCRNSKADVVTAMCLGKFMGRHISLEQPWQKHYTLSVN